MRYMAIDLGGKRTGLAVGDDDTRIASPIGAIQAGDDVMRMRELGKHIDQQQPDALVVGLPLNMDGSDGPAAEGARAMAMRLKTQFGLPVHLVDERLTSDAADTLMAQSGLTHGQKKARRDALAAMAILMRYFEQMTND